LPINRVVIDTPLLHNDDVTVQAGVDAAGTAPTTTRRIAFLNKGDTVQHS
jgi:hypothetical protein